MNKINDTNKDKSIIDTTDNFLLASDYILSHQEGQKWYRTKMIDKRTWNEILISYELFNILKKCDGSCSISEFQPWEIEILKSLVNQGIVVKIHRDYQLMNNNHIKKGLYKLPRYIEGVIIHITGRCNLRCKHCYFSYFDDTNELRTDEWENVFEQLHELGVYKIQITGGEPLCREDLIDILKFCKKYCFLTAITTNATLLDEDILSEILKAGVNAFGCSLDGASSETYKDFRGKDLFQKVLDNLMLLKEYRDRKKLAYFSISSMLTKRTIKELFKLYKVIIYEIKPNVWGVERPYISGRYKKYFKDYYIPVEKTAPYLHHLLLQIEKDLPRYPYRIQLDKYWTWLNPNIYGHVNLSEVYAPYTLNDSMCGRHFQHLYILPNGDVTWCDYKEACPEPIGNVKKKPIIEIWNIMEKLKKDMILRNAQCKDCNYLKYCGGGCRLIPVLKGDGLFGCDTDFKYYIEYGIRMGLYNRIIESKEVR